METPGPSFTKQFRGTKFVNAIKRHSAANFERRKRFCETGSRTYGCEVYFLVFVLFNSISVISEGRLGDYERLCVLKLRLRLERLPPRALSLLSYRGFRL